MSINFMNLINKSKWNASLYKDCLIIKLREGFLDNRINNCICCYALDNIVPTSFGQLCSYHHFSLKCTSTNCKRHANIFSKNNAIYMYSKCTDCFKLETFYKSSPCGKRQYERPPRFSPVVFDNTPPIAPKPVPLTFSQVLPPIPPPTVSQVLPPMIPQSVSSLKTHLDFTLTPQQEIASLKYRMFALEQKVELLESLLATK
jgi:hypothetical protein